MEFRYLNNFEDLSFVSVPYFSIYKDFHCQRAYLLVLVNSLNSVEMENSQTNKQAKSPS